MRPSGKEVNVEQRSIVPQRSWLARLYLWACERLYAELAWVYDWVSWLVSAGQWGRWQAGVWREVRGQRVLEIGFGTGRLLREGTLRGFEMVGVDRSREMGVVARSRLEKAHLRYSLLLGDGRALPLVDGCFDTVMATFPAGYIFDSATLTEMRRVLCEGGRLVLLGLWVELHVGPLGRWIPLFYGRPNKASLERLRLHVEQAGFRAQWVEQRHGWFTVGVLVAERA